MKKLILVLIVLFIGLTLSGCSLQGQNQNINSSPRSETAPNTITIENFSFNPAVLTVARGTKVAWINKDSVTHTVASSSFKSSNLNTGEKFEFTFDTAGVFDYACGIHPSMKGKVKVK